MCKYHNHNDCYQKTREIDPWFPHSLEEIVIWTVERETGESGGRLLCFLWDKHIRIQGFIGRDLPVCNHKYSSLLE